MTCALVKASNCTLIVKVHFAASNQWVNWNSSEHKKRGKNLPQMYSRHSSPVYRPGFNCILRKPLRDTNHNERAPLAAKSAPYPILSHVLFEFSRHTVNNTDLPLIGPLCIKLVTSNFGSPRGAEFAYCSLAYSDANSCGSPSPKLLVYLKYRQIPNRVPARQRFSQKMLTMPLISELWLGLY